MRYTGPKNKVARREQTDLGMKTLGSKAHASLLKRLNVLPGQHGTRTRRKVSERGKQLREKQKLRMLFGITESQLKNYYKKAQQMKGNTSVLLGNFLEQRLDNVVYRLGFAPTRASARQLVSHKHVKVNKKTLNISSYHVTQKDKVSLNSEDTKKIPYIESHLANKSIIIPKWLTKKNEVGQIVSDPTDEEIGNQVNMRSVIEYYSR